MRFIVEKLESFITRYPGLESGNAMSIYLEFDYVCVKVRLLRRELLVSRLRYRCQKSP